jgi:hypothetical protein
MHDWQRWNRSAGSRLSPTGAEGQLGDKAQLQMPEQAEGKIVRNLVEALERLHEDLDRVELWTAALNSFQRPVPDYKPREQYLLGSVRQPEHGAQNFDHVFRR